MSKAVQTNVMSVMMKCYDEKMQRKVFVKVCDPHTVDSELIQRIEHQNNIYLKSKGINAPEIYEIYPSITIMEHLDFVESENDADLDLVIESMIGMHSNTSD